MNMNQISIGKFIAEKRKAKNLTQAQLAERLNISNKTISKWETGKSMPDYSIMESLCNELDISISELLNGEKPQVNNDEQMIELVQRVQQLENQKNSLNGIILIVMGIALMALSFILEGSAIKDFISGLLLGISVVEMLVGVYISVRYLKK